MRQLINGHSPEVVGDDMLKVVTSVKDRVLIRSAPSERRAEEGAPDYERGLARAGGRRNVRSVGGR